MNWSILATLFSILIAIAAWGFSRPSAHERQLLAGYSRVDLFLFFARKNRQRPVSADDERVLRQFRRRSLTAGFVALAPLVTTLVLVFQTAEAPAPSAQEISPQKGSSETRPAKTAGPKKVVRSYIPAPDGNGPPIVVDEFREETLEEKRDPIRLYGAAKVKPRYDNEQLLGISITSIEPGSFWEMVGFREGDFIIEANGELMDDPNTSVAFMNAMQDAPEVIVRVRGTDEIERTLVYNAPDE